MEEELPQLLLVPAGIVLAELHELTGEITVVEDVADQVRICALSKIEEFEKAATEHATEAGGVGAEMAARKPADVFTRMNRERVNPMPFGSAFGAGKGVHTIEERRPKNRRPIVDDAIDAFDLEEICGDVIEKKRVEDFSEQESGSWEYTGRDGGWSWRERRVRKRDDEDAAGAELNGGGHRCVETESTIHEELAMNRNRWEEKGNRSRGEHVLGANAIRTHDEVGRQSFGQLDVRAAIHEDPGPSCRDMSRADGERFERIATKISGELSPTNVFVDDLREGARVEEARAARAAHEDTAELGGLEHPKADDLIELETRPERDQALDPR